MPLKRHDNHLYAAMDFTQYLFYSTAKLKSCIANSHTPLPANYSTCISGRALKPWMHKLSND